MITTYIPNPCTPHHTVRVCSHSSLRVYLAIINHKLVTNTICSPKFETEHHLCLTALTSLKSSSRRCCLRRSIFLTATCRPVVRSVEIHTMPVEPSPILMKFSRSWRGSPGLTTISRARRNYTHTHISQCWCLPTHQLHTSSVVHIHT